MSSEGKNLEAISKAIDHHNATCEYPAVAVAMNPFEVERLGWDSIRGLIALVESGVHDPVNIGNPNEMTLLEMAKTVVEMTESRSEIVFEALPVDDPQVRQPDITRARDLLGWEPEVDLREGLAKTIEHASAHLTRL